MTDVIMWLVRYSIVPVMIAFLLTVIFTYWPGRRDRIQRDAMIPFHDER
jgi:cbb3-type cytochrome oxidase subunit 3